jgi:hypothetical protein
MDIAQLGIRVVTHRVRTVTMSQRRWAAAIVLVLAALVALVSAVNLRKEANGATPSDGLAQLLGDFAGRLDADAPYRPPTADERRQAVGGLTALLDGQPLSSAKQALEPLGFNLRNGADPVTGREYVLAVNERTGPRAWGAYLVDRSAPIRLAVEVPHPNFDLMTDQIGLALYRQAPGSIMLVAGTHRRAADGLGDVAHQENSLFHALATGVATRKIMQVQLHGFHDDSLPDADVVVSPGSGQPPQVVRRVAERLKDIGLATCVSWNQNCGRLEGTRNVQGRKAAELDAPFLHLEISRSVRDDSTRWTHLIRALAESALPS